MTQLRLVVEYNGRNFSGWQVQPGVRTVQGELHRALETVLHVKLPLPVSSGRTDAGVSARRQVVCVRPPLGESEFCMTGRSFSDLAYRILVGVGSILKSDLAVLRVDEVGDEFHPIGDVVQKQYSYTAWNHPSPPALQFGFCSHVTARVDLEKMRQAASVLVGRHDFSSFRATRCSAKSPVREVFGIDIEQEGESLVLRFRGKGFLKQMVRNMVGTLFEIGRGAMGERTMEEILHGKDRSLAGPTAEPWGLMLDWVEYPEGRL